MTDTVTYRLHFPRELGTGQVLGVLLALNGTSTVRGLPLQLLVRGSCGRLDHLLIVTQTGASLTAQLTQLLPGLRLDPVEDAARTAPTFAWRLWQSTSRRPLRIDHPDLTTRAVLTALLAVRGPEWLELSWRFGPVRRPLSVGSRHAPVLSESWPLALAAAAVRAPGDLDADARQALRRKRSEPAWRLVGNLVVGGTVLRPRAQHLAAGLLAAVRTSEGPRRALRCSAQ